MKKTESVTPPLDGAIGSADRDGNWLDKWGACKVCDGELPHGHSDNCDVYKLEVRVAQLEAALRSVLNLTVSDGVNKIVEVTTAAEKTLMPNVQADTREQSR